MEVWVWALSLVPIMAPALTLVLVLVQLTFPGMVLGMVLLGTVKDQKDHSNKAVPLRLHRLHILPCSPINLDLLRRRLTNNLLRRL